MNDLFDQQKHKPPPTRLECLAAIEAVKKAQPNVQLIRGKGFEKDGSGACLLCFLWCAATGRTPDYAFHLWADQTYGHDVKMAIQHGFDLNRYDGRLTETYSMAKCLSRELLG